MIEFFLSLGFTPYISKITALLLEGTFDTFYMVFLATAISIIFGVPLGVILTITSKNGITPCRWLNVILNALVNMGKIQKIDMPDNLTRYDKILSHDHFICTNCSNVYDLNRSDISYNEYIDGNKVCNCKIIYEGIGHDCINK